MILELNDPTWRTIFNNIMAEYPDDSVRARDIERRLAQLGVTVVKDLDDRWNYVLLPYGEDERVLFMLRWG